MEDPNHSKRRRGLGVVTPNACTECRKKRAKCDGANPCGRCKSQAVQCKYEIPVRQSKENMRAEIDQLRKQQHQSDRVLAAIVSDDGSENILQRLREGETLENISENLDTGKEKPFMISNLNVGHDNTNVTTYRQPGDQQAIQNAVYAAASLTNSPFSVEPFGDTYGGSMEGQNPQSNMQWPTWAAAGSTRQLSNATHSDDMVEWSPNSHGLSQSAYPLIGTWHEQTSGSDVLDTTIQWAREQGRGYILGNHFASEEDHNSPRVNEPWTQVTSDGELVEHLMALYFCWEYPTFASLSKEHFLDDFRSGRRRHCSSLLVNAMLAVGCRFSTQAAARADADDSNTAGDHFFAEAVRLLDKEKDRHNLTTIQALGLMSIREASSGRSSESIYYAGQSVMIAIEMGLHLESQSGGGDDATLDHAVKSATFWGAFSLDQAWSICIGRLPHFSKDTKLMAKPAIVDHVERSSWVPYTDDGDITEQLPKYHALTAEPGAPLERNCTQPSNVRSVYKTFCELSEIVHQALYVFYTPGTQLSSKSLLDVYTQYLKWYDVIPEALRLGHNFTPAVLFAHMYYHFAILLLFRPFIKLQITSSGVSPRDVCNQAADAIAALVNSYSQLYTLRRTPSFVPYFVLTSSITHLVTLGISGGGPEHLQQGICDLKVMSGCHGFAQRAQDILIFLAYDWKIEVSFDENDDDKSGTKIDPKTLGRPRSSSSNFFAPNVGMKDIMDGVSPEKMKNNPLFWPFPFQGRPLLGEGAMLELSGFKILSLEDGDRDAKMEGSEPKEIVLEF